MRIALVLVFLYLNNMQMKGKVVTIQDEQVKIELEDGQCLFAPSLMIEGVPKEGMDVAIIIAAIGSEDAGRQTLAKDLLNGLLTG